MLPTDKNEQPTRPIFLVFNDFPRFRTIVRENERINTFFVDNDRRRTMGCCDIGRLCKS